MHCSYFIVQKWLARQTFSPSPYPTILKISRRLISSQQPATVPQPYSCSQEASLWQRCRLHAKSSVWWLNISKIIQNCISQCSECQQSFIPPREPLITSPLPLHPWEKVASDLFHLDSKTYLIVVDYFSCYPEVIQMISTTSVAVIKALKSVFSRHGVPSVFMSDNGPQFVSKDKREFANSYGFDLVSSSPLYPQSNGLAERTIKTVKMLLRDSADPYIALLSFCSTPIPWCQFSPAELLMGRRLKTDVPILKTELIPQWPYLDAFREKDKEYKNAQKQIYDQRHRTRYQDPLPPESSVWVRTGND